MKKYPLLILHGWNLTADKFAPLLNTLSKKGYTAEAIDLPGFGKTPIPSRPYELADYVEFVEHYIKKKKWREVVIIGHSFGGRISIKLASKNPSYLKGLILSGTPGFNPVPRLKIVFFLTLAKIGNAVFALPLLKNISALFRYLLYKAAKAQDFYHTDKHMRDTFKQIVKEELADYMQKITVPTLLIWGENDLIVPLSIGEKMKNTIPNAQLVIIPEARHGVPWTHTKEFLQSVDNYLKKL